MILQRLHLNNGCTCHRLRRIIIFDMVVGSSWAFSSRHFLLPLDLMLDKRIWQLCLKCIFLGQTAVELSLMQTSIWCLDCFPD